MKNEIKKENILQTLELMKDRFASDKELQSVIHDMQQSLHES